jgi:hypothetical protein
MIKKNISYIVSLVLLVLLVVVIIMDRSETFDRVRNKSNIDTLIIEPPTSSNVDTIIKQMEDVDSIYVKLKEEKRRLEVIQKKNTMEKSRIKDSIMKIERLKAKEEKLKIKELYEKQLDKIPNYRGCDIDTFKVEIK